ncbi:ATP-dependent RNA helicase dbp10 [Elasticomyces elasticus]|nr:ATP-dependent RNA helicase dbp10 [Elasticomyces elasticus]
MLPRASSPAQSENDYDISAALFRKDGDQDGFDEQTPARADAILQSQGERGALSESDDDEAFIAAQLAAVNRKTATGKGPGGKKGGAFQAMGLNPVLLKAITRKGFAVPTPIQRKTIPIILDGQDVVGMARTGSGKTAAFVVPMIEKLKAHSAKVGARAVVLSPSRELALQTLKVVKELGRGTDLRTILLVGGDSLEDQFSSMASNPDIIIATPGRFEHLKVEMGLELSSVRYVVFDEADRLFEMGFAAQLSEILHSLPTSRQTLLFSATLPKSLVEFARAGLQDPRLVRLDAESKISPDLESAFFTIKSAEKEGALMHILQDIVQVPTGLPEAAKNTKDHSKQDNSDKKRKRGHDAPKPTESPTAHSTIVFAATKHHVEYLSALLRASGYAVSYVYGTLDQTARKIQVQDFRSGLTNILVVTDVAARGIDIPVLANVINYDFPPQPKIFVHRVGRTARAGKRGWSYSLVTQSDMPYLLDLQLFLGKRLILGREGTDRPSFAENIVVGGLVRQKLDRTCEEAAKLLEEQEDVAALRSVAIKGEKQYIRTRNSASSESAKRAKALSANRGPMESNLLFDDIEGHVEALREQMLARISGFRPAETVFEIGKRGTTSELTDAVRKRREKIQNRTNVGAGLDAVKGQVAVGEPDLAGDTDQIDGSNATGGEEADELPSVDFHDDSASELEVSFSQVDNKKSRSAANSWQDAEHFMSYMPTTINATEDRAYGVTSGSYNTQKSNTPFLQAAQGATMDLANDDSKAFAEPSRAKGLRWDKKSKKYVARANDEDGSKGQKYVLGESGQKIPASFRSGRFDAWRKANKISSLPRVGEFERSNAQFRSGPGGGGPQRRFKHNAERAPKDADKYRDDFYVRKKRVEEAKAKRIGRFKEGAGKKELKGVEDVRKARKLAERKKAKNARPAKRGKA